MPLDETAPGFLDRGPIQISESLAECDEIFVGQILPANQENRVVQPGSVDAREIVGLNRSQIHSLDFRSQRFSRWED
jgi:hypothetical protein